MFNFMFPQQNGVLSQNPQTTMMGQQPVLAGATGNARGSNRTPMYPNQQIGLGEGLMRIGGNIVGASQDGGLAAFQAGTQSYGDIQDYNRAREMEQYQYEQEQKLAEQRRQDLLRKMNSSNQPEQPEQADTTEISRLEGLLNDLRNDPNLTGPIAGRAQNALDRSGFGDPKRAAKRLILSELQVNATLAYTAQTKGAITDREMALFQTPVPKLTDDEQVWISWLEPQLEVLKQLQQNGITDEAAKQQGITPSNSTTVPDDDGYTIEEVPSTTNN